MDPFILTKASLGQIGSILLVCWNVVIQNNGKNVRDVLDKISSIRVHIFNCLSDTASSKVRYGNALDVRVSDCLHSDSIFY